MIADVVTAPISLVYRNMSVEVIGVRASLDH